MKQEANLSSFAARLKVSAWAVCVGGVCVLFGLPGYSQQATHTYPELPDGAGKDTLIKVCGACHSPDNVIANGRDRAGWEEEITKMAGFGADGTDEEFTAILDYLVKTSGYPADDQRKQSCRAQLEAGLDLTTAEADAVVDYRKKNGDFKSIEDLKKVPDVDAKKIDAKKDKLTF